MSACDDGDYNNLDCDPNVYESECLSNNSYMYCRDGILTVVECGTQSVCQSKKKAHQDGTEEIVVSCEPLDQKPKAECTTNADCKDASKPVCSAQGVCVAAEQKPECTTNDDCKDASKPVCSEQGVCVANETPTDTVDPCKDVTCTEGTCDRGVCVTDAMKNANENDECDSNFGEFCDGSTMVFCGDDSKVHKTSCASDGGCAIVLDSDGTKTAWCNGPSDKCTEEEQNIGFCKELDEDESVQSYYLCMKNTEGSFTAVNTMLMGNYEECDDGCNAAKTSCSYESCTQEGESTTYCDVDEYYGERVVTQKTCVKQIDGGLGYSKSQIQTCASNCKSGECVPWFEGEGKPCKASEYADSCKGDDNNVVAYCEGGVVKALNCEEYKCLVDIAGTYANCYDKDNTCEELNAKESICSTQAGYGSYTKHYVCTELSDGSKRFMDDLSKGPYGTEECDLTCAAADSNGDSSACAALTDEAGTACSDDAKAYCGTGKSCALIDFQNKKHVVCYADTDVCETEGESTSVCDKEEGAETSTVCTRAIDGTTLINVQFEQNCALGCGDDNKCVSPIGENNKCNEAAVAYCARVDGVQCAIMDGKMKCYVAEGKQVEKCTTLNAETQECREGSDGYYLATLKCTAADDGETLINVVDETKNQLCDVVCDPDLKACIENEVVDGQCTKLEDAKCRYDNEGCALIDGVENCYNGMCTEEGAVKESQCVDFFGLAYFTSSVKCFKTDDNRLVWSSALDVCADGCNDEGTACK